MYVPPAVITELDDIMRENQINSKADAFKDLTKYARVGREAERLMKLDFSKASKLPSIDFFYRKGRKRK